MIVNFYQELGLSAQATESEIRRSYKRLTQLLHPDHHQDQELRALADAQMKRLNEMIAILTDPDQRRSYDQSIAESPVSVIQNAPHKYGRLLNNRGWLFLLLLLVLFALSAWLVPLFDDTRSPARVSLQLPIPPPQSEPHNTFIRRIVPVNKQIPTASIPSDSAIPPPELRDTPPASTTDDPLRTLLLPPSAPHPAAPSLLGRWVYSPNSSDSPNPKLYAPVYVELAITEAGGVLHGLYHSTYKVPDRAVNPAVNFVFDGAATDSKFLWRGDGGAKGEITANLESPAKLKIAWFASTMGSALSLGSGSATLYRFR